MDLLDQIYMAKSKKKADYIIELLEITRAKANKLTVKQLRQLISRHA